MEKTIVTKSDWQIEEMPFFKTTFTLRRHFNDDEIRILKQGHIPQEMEDKWFWYFENDTLYAHRSWTGYCIYSIRFNHSTDTHRVTVNRDRKQYSCKSKSDDLKQINRLLDWWIQPDYDYYGEWLDETTNALRNNAKNKQERGNPT